MSLGNGGASWYARSQQASVSSSASTSAARLVPAQARRRPVPAAASSAAGQAVRAFPLSDVQAMLGHAHIATTMRYVHHRPGADDAARLSGAFAGDSVSPLVSRTRDIEHNSAQLSDTDEPANG